MLISLVLAMMLPGDPKQGRKLVFDDEFSKGGAIDTTRWLYDDGPVYNDELERYTSSPLNSRVEHGNLVITARKDGGKITSARIESKAAWRYGYFECRAKVPGGRGTWPAFWMLNESLRQRDPKKQIGWPQCGEIDIMEEVGYDPDSFHFSLHSGKINWMRKEQRTKVVTTKDGAGRFHVFGLDWRPDSLRFFLDGKDVFDVQKTSDDPGIWPFKDPFYLILNLAIGGNWGGAKGVDDKIFPSSYYVDYVRVYQ
jgi:beta-glucanase (GH16 family)